MQTIIAPPEILYPPAGALVADFAAAGALAVDAATFGVGTTVAVASEAVASLFASPVVVAPALHHGKSHVAQQALPTSVNTILEINLSYTPVKPSRRPISFLSTFMTTLKHVVLPQSINV